MASECGPVFLSGGLEKGEGVVLGIELDSVSQVARLPGEKLLALKELITLWLT